MTDSASIILKDEQATVDVGRQIAAATDSGVVIYLHGNLGMGKTTLTRGVLQAFGHSGAVKSPTYTLVEPYEIKDRQIFHFDLYRLGNPEELEYMGIRDYFDDDAVCLVEWPDKGLGVLPKADIEVYLKMAGLGRAIELQANNQRGQSIADQVYAQYG